MFHGEKEKKQLQNYFSCNAVIVVDEGLDAREIWYNKESKASSRVP